MDNIWLAIWSSVKPQLTIAAVVAVTTAAVQGLVIWGARHLLEASIKAHFDKVLEDYKFELKAHEQAAKIAEYASLAVNLKDTDDPQLYRRANQLSWELFLWLPDDVYRKLGRGVTSKASKEDLVYALTDVRRLLLRDKAGTLGLDDIIGHGPNIGYPKPPQ